MFIQRLPMTKKSCFFQILYGRNRCTDHLLINRTGTVPTLRKNCPYTLLSMLYQNGRSSALSPSAVSGNGTAS